jgi:hypothetical protein
MSMPAAAQTSFAGKIVRRLVGARRFVERTGDFRQRESFDSSIDPTTRTGSCAADTARFCLRR